MAKTHRLRKHRLYTIWAHMKERCFNPNTKAYPDYGGRGITMCNEWKDSFISFYEWAMGNGYRDDLTIDREHNDGHYAPTNCRWIPFHEQMFNQRRSINITYKGETLPLKQWAKKLNISYITLYSRVKVYNFSLDKLFEEVDPGKASRRKVMIYDRNENPLMIVASKALAAKIIESDGGAIWRQMAGVYKHVKGFKFKYIDQFNTN